MNPLDNVVPTNTTCAFCEANMAVGSSGISLFFGGKGTHTQKSFMACGDCVQTIDEMFQNRLGCGDLDFSSVMEEEETEVRGG